MEGVVQSLNLKWIGVVRVVSVSRVSGDGAELWKGCLPDDCQGRAFREDNLRWNWVMVRCRGGFVVNCIKKESFFVTLFWKLRVLDENSNV